MTKKQNENKINLREYPHVSGSVFTMKIIYKLIIKKRELIIGKFLFWFANHPFFYYPALFILMHSKSLLACQQSIFHQ